MIRALTKRRSNGKSRPFPERFQGEIRRVFPNLRSGLIIGDFTMPRSSQRGLLIRKGIFICRYRLSNIGKAISNVSWIWNVQKTRTQTLGPQHPEKIAEERSGDNGRDREHEPGMVETLPRISL